MLEALNVVAIIVAGLMVGCELAIAAFIHPTLDKLPDDAHLPAASAIARMLGTVIAVLVQPYAFAYVSRGCNPMAPIWPLTYLDRCIGRFVDAGDCLYAHRPRAGQQPY
jgi:hypothetical protein